MGDGFVVNLEISVRKNSKNNGELREAEAARAESVDNEPRVGEPSDFGENEAYNEGDISRVLLVALDEDVVRGGETDEKFGGDEDDRIGDGGEDGGGRRPEEDRNEGLDDGEARRGTGFDKNEPDGIANHENKVNWEEGGAGGVGEKDEADADDEIDEAGAEIK